MSYRLLGIVAALCAAGFISACGESDSVAGNEPSTSMAAATPRAAAQVLGQTPSSTGANGWASVGGNGTTGGEGADAAHTYTVTNRTELIKALYSGAVVNADGSFSGTKDNTKKIIYIQGTIELNADGSGKVLTADDYLPRNNCLATLQQKDPSVTNAATLYDKYYATYDPNVWNAVLVSGKPRAVDKTDASQIYEVARACAADRQKKVVVIPVGSNTSILGLGADAKIVHGNLTMDAGVDNVVIRNITFEDAFDLFPAWDPTDSFPTVTDTPSSTGCATATPTKCVGGRWNSAYDNLSVLGATHIWIDHNDISDGENVDSLHPPVASWNFGGNAQTIEQHIQHHDALIDITKNSNYITVSWNRLHDHDKLGLLGGTDTASTSAENPTVLNVTFHHNFYERTRQRQPRARFGKVHVYNNYYVGQMANKDGGPDYAWLTAWTSGTASKLYIENNVVTIAPSADGSKVPTAANLVSIGTTTANATKCTSVGYSSADCGTYFYDSGNVFNGTVLTTELYTEIKRLVSASSSNAPIVWMDPTQAGVYWKSSNSYSYTVDPASSVAASVSAGAGVGKL